MTAPFKPLVMVPSYNTGGTLLCRSVGAALESGEPVLVVIDGSTDGSAAALEAKLGGHERLDVLKLPRNGGKGAAVRAGAEHALKKGYTHLLAMDADGQHPASLIGPMLKLAEADPGAIIMGQPVFGGEAPLSRVYGRRLTSFWTNLETLWCGLGDTLFGMRVYPLKSLLAAFRQTRFARGFDFDPEIAVRMAWSGCRPRQIKVPVRYLPREEGGISHFHYLRDNAKLTLLHFRLVPEFLVVRLVPFLKHLRQWKESS